VSAGLLAGGGSPLFDPVGQKTFWCFSASFKIHIWHTKSQPEQKGEQTEHKTQNGFRLFVQRARSKHISPLASRFRLLFLCVFTFFLLSDAALTYNDSIFNDKKTHTVKGKKKQESLSLTERAN
jgi:hypothetical protein